MGSNRQEDVTDRIAMIAAQAPFRASMKRKREAKRWSQERLASEAEMDHSLVSRLEGGQRLATRQAVERLGLALYGEEGKVARAQLLILAGYMPGAEFYREVLEHIAPMPLGELYTVLTDDTLPDDTKHHVRTLVAGLIRLCDNVRREVGHGEGRFSAD